MSEAALTVHEAQSAPAVQPAPQSETAAILSMIALAARDPSVDIDKMRQLYAWKKEIESDAAQKEFNTAMAAAQAEIKPVAKNADNTQTKSRYATLDAIDEAISPIVARHGFGTSFDTADSPVENCYRITCEVSHIGGHSKNYHADVPIDGAGFKGTANKTATHAFASTITYGRRILKMMVFDVSTKNAVRDDDGNSAGEPPAFITDEECRQVNDLIASKRANLDAFLRHFKIECVPDLLSRDLPRALDMLNRK